MKEVNGYNPSKDQRLINCKTECGNERCYARRYGLFAEKTCTNFVEPKPQTNADRIRAMSDEELAEWLERIRLCCATDLCGRRCPFAEVCYSNAEAPKETLDWLRQEVLDA